MSSRSFPILTAILLSLVGLTLPLGCANTNQIVDSAAIVITPKPIETLDTPVSETSITFMGHTATVDGAALAGTRVAIADNATQQLVTETNSDANGAFTITLDNVVGDYTVLASYQDDDIMLAAWQNFTISDEVQNYQFDLVLNEVSIIDENNDDGATPPPYGSGCYQVYTRNYMCSLHVWYVATYWTGPWYCYALNGGVNWVGVGSC